MSGEAKPSGRRPRGIGLFTMILVSICLHAGLVGVAAFIPRNLFNHAPKTEDLLDLGVDIELGEEVQELIVAENTPPPEPMVTPPEPPPVPVPPAEMPPPPDEPPPPPMAEPEIVETKPPVPREKPKPERPTPPKTLPRRAEPPPAEAKRGPVAQEGVVGGNVARSEKTTGTPGGQKVSNTGWRTPRPPYPFAARKTRIQGSGSIRIRTNAAGKVVSAEVSGSIHPLLDSNTVRYALSSWSGPPNTTKTVPVTYQLQ